MEIEFRPPFNLTAVEEGILADAVAGRPVKRTPEQGIDDMQAWIKYFTIQINNLATRISESSDEATALIETLAGIKTELDAAKARLSEYELMQRSMN